MAVRLIALDLDGTALREHREMTERTREAILAALDAGILVVPSTGHGLFKILISCLLINPLTCPSSTYISGRITRIPLSSNQVTGGNA